MSVKDVAGSLTSCYMGSFNADYKQTSMSYIWDTNPYSATGLGMAMISNRLSWFFDLRGGSMTIDTACSSSLIAMHLGIQSLRTGEAKMVSTQIAIGELFANIPVVYRRRSELDFGTRNNERIIRPPFS